MLAAQEGQYRCLQKLITKTSKYKLLIDSNKCGYNSLMLAIKNKNNICANIIFDNITAINLKETEKINGFTAIHLAILYKSTLIEKLINKADNLTLKITSYSYDSILSTATQQEDVSTINLILKKCSKSIPYEKNSKGLNPIMIAASNGYLSCLKKLFEYSENKLLLKTNNNEENILMLATKNGHAECVNFLLQNCQKDTLKKLYRQTNNIYYDVLCIAKYCNSKPIYLEDNNETITKKNKKILSDLIKYKPY
jgi:ankyrin repeat protein